MTKEFRFNFPRFRQQFRHSDLSGGDLVCAIGSYFLAVPYESGILDCGRRERLVADLNRFDCFTYVETVVALARCVAAYRISGKEFRRNLQFIRYRGGVIGGYSSRLHYFTDWLADNERKKVLSNISVGLGAAACRKKINYMTTHLSAYRTLSAKDELEKMTVAEKNISRRVFTIIPPAKIAEVSGKIKPGDIIAFAASESGLDIAHVGFACRQSGYMRLLHASSKEGAVVVSRQTLPAYLKQNAKFSGIVVARVL